MAKIVFEEVTKTFPTKDKKNKEQCTALDGIDLEIEAGEFVVVVGPSGCGKSTLLDLLGGLSRPTSGRILLDGKPITGPGLDRGIVFQQYALLPWRTALGNVEFGLEATGVPRRARKSRAREFLELVGLTGFEDRHPHELSGGMRQRVAIAVPLGLLIGWYRPVAVLLGPLLEVFRNTAALALLPVFVLLLGIGETSKVSIVVYACVWPVLLNTISAVGNADPTLVGLARSMDLSTPRLFQKVILPSSVPAVFTGIRLAGAVSILVLVAAEMIGAKAGLGYLINASQYNFAIPQMYAGIVTISAIGVAFNQLLVTVERRLSTWRVPA
ncbi:ATP-binding cassette domain-containing protein [Streptomyces sp. NPDC097617]|uniref:ATP-binding cassette domain-containing protein n=1 Tax=Streptomyces sp. NPDC097617 TaxID=3366091 RepID=UPI0037F5D1EB